MRKTGPQPKLFQLLEKEKMLKWQLQRGRKRIKRDWVVLQSEGCTVKTDSSPLGKESKCNTVGTDSEKLMKVRHSQTMVVEM